MIPSIQNPLMYLIINPKSCFYYGILFVFAESYSDPEDTPSLLFDDKNGA